MNISDEQDLAGRLDQAFQAITPREAPLDQAVRQGTVIRVRRRLAAVAGVAVVAAGIAIPVLLNQQAPQPVLNHPRYHVTVHPAGPHSEALRNLAGSIDRYTYWPYDRVQGTAARDLLFRLGGSAGAPFRRYSTNFR